MARNRQKWPKIVKHSPKVAKIVKISDFVNMAKLINFKTPSKKAIEATSTFNIRWVKL